jgi:cell shape-determining protein MreC
VKNSNPSDRRIAELEKENHRLKEKLKQAETIIDVQKKLSEILRIPLDPTGEKI